MLRIKRKEVKADRFINSGIVVHQAEKDSDLLIVLTALDTAQKKPYAQVYIVGEDVDLLVPLLYHSSQADNTDVKLFKPVRTTGKQPSLVYNPTNIRSKFPGIENYILFLHAFSGLRAKLIGLVHFGLVVWLTISAHSGCDSTSTFFGKRKSTVFKWL